MDWGPVNRRIVTTAGGGGRTKVGGGGGGRRELGFTNRPSADAAVPRPSAARKQATSKSRGAAGAASASATQAQHFPLLAFLITEGTEDALHESYLTSYVELDQSGDETLLYQDIGHPNVQGPTVRRLVKDGVLRFDPGDLQLYEEAVKAAGGERAYRRQEISRLRERLGWQEEETPFLGIINSARPAEYALLKIPETAVQDSRESRRLWKTIQSALAEEHLKGIHAGARWDDKTIRSLQKHLDAAADQLAEGQKITSEASLVEGETDWTITFGGRRHRLGKQKGLVVLRRLVEQPGTSISATDLWQETPSGVLPRGPAGREDAARTLTVGLAYGTEVMDQRARSEIEIRYQRKVEDLKTAEDTGDYARAQRLEEEAGDLLKELCCSTGLGGRPRRMGDQGRQQVDAVRKQIKRAVDAIAAVHPSAGTHLRSSLRIGQECRYDPDPPVTWTT